MAQRYFDEKRCFDDDYQPISGKQSIGPKGSLPPGARVSSDELRALASNPGLAVHFGRSRPLTSTWDTELWRRRGYPIIR